MNVNCDDSRNPLAFLKRPFFFFSLSYCGTRLPKSGLFPCDENVSDHVPNAKTPNGGRGASEVTAKSTLRKAKAAGDDLNMRACNHVSACELLQN